MALLRPPGPCLCLRLDRLRRCERQRLPRYGRRREATRAGELCRRRRRHVAADRPRGRHPRGARLPRRGRRQGLPPLANRAERPDRIPRHSPHVRADRRPWGHGVAHGRQPLACRGAAILRRRIHRLVPPVHARGVRRGPLPRRRLLVLDALRGLRLPDSGLAGIRAHRGGRRREARHVGPLRRRSRGAHGLIRDDRDRAWSLLRRRAVPAPRDRLLGLARRGRGSPSPRRDLRGRRRLRLGHARPRGPPHRGGPRRRRLPRGHAQLRRGLPRLAPRLDPGGLVRGRGARAQGGGRQADHAGHDPVCQVDPDSHHNQQAHPIL